MIKIKELVIKLSSSDFKELNLVECSEIKRGVRVTKSQLSSDKPYPVYSGGVTPMGYFDNFNQAENTITIVKYGTAGFVNYIQEKFWANDVCYCIKPSKLLNTKFLYFVLKNQQEEIYALVNRDAVPSHLPTEGIESIKIPIPSLEIQIEIVKILDRFTELEAELVAELEARTQQYEYYRNKLLDFSNGFVGVPKIDNMIKELCPDGVEFTKVEQVIDILRGRRLTKNVLMDNGKFPVMHGGRTPLGFYDESNRKENTTIVINTGSSSGEVYFIEEKFWSSDACFSIYSKSSYLDKFIYYFLNNNEQLIKSKIRSGAMPTINANSIADIRIPIVGLEIQKEIVKILDKFNKLVTSISEGLPAEIKARKQQYEYYRNKLLTFEERQ